jgi:prepilin-type N-terminal cleavage/methylation domain-containing protein
MPRSRNTQAGFTIIELMISTAVFATILLVVLTAVTQIGRMYYKGITTAKTQEVTRGLVDRISQEIQFAGPSTTPVSGVGPSTGNGLLCLGSSRYFFVANKVVGPTTHAVWYDNLGTGCTAANVAATADSANMSAAAPITYLPPTKGGELLPEGYRLGKLVVTAGGSSLYTVSVRVVYGADDLIESGTAGVYTSPPNAAFVPAKAVCKGSQVGTQFCAVSELTTSVLKRTN